MKNVKFLLSAACMLFAVGAMAQQDFSGPQYAKWGDTPEEREKNILNSNFLKESYENRDYDAAARYLRDLLKNCPGASVAIYQRGANVYKQKINRAKSNDEKNAYVDSLMMIYDMRAEYFGDSAKQGRAFILDQKAREYLAFRPVDRAGIRKLFREAIEAGGNSADPETVVAYFSNLCDDYRNTDEVMPDEVLAEYERLTPFFETHPEAKEFKDQFDAAFGLSGAASCENLERLFSTRLAAAPDDEALLEQAVSLMSRAKCTSDFFLTTAEKYYAVKPSANTALALAQIFQEKLDYTKAMSYLNEALAVEKVDAERQKLLARIGLVGLAANNVSEAAAAARQARDLNPEDGVPYFVLAQCYGLSAAACGGFSRPATLWAAFDTLAKAIGVLPRGFGYPQPAQSALFTLPHKFPRPPEWLFNALQARARDTVTRRTAAGVTTTVRPR